MSERKVASLLVQQKRKSFLAGHSKQSCETDSDAVLKEIKENITHKKSTNFIEKEVVFLSVQKEKTSRCRS